MNLKRVIQIAEWHRNIFWILTDFLFKTFINEVIY